MSHDHDCIAESGDFDGNELMPIRLTAKVLASEVLHELAGPDLLAFLKLLLISDACGRFRAERSAIVRCLAAGGVLDAGEAWPGVITRLEKFGLLRTYEVRGESYAEFHREVVTECLEEEP